MGNAIGILCPNGCEVELEVEDGNEDREPKEPALLYVWELLKCPKCGDQFDAEYTVSRREPDE
jgi:hypothetical protein